MKRRIFSVLFAVCLLAALFIPVASSAVSGVYFTAINNTLLPLDDSAMPSQYSGMMYVPYSLFTDNGLGIYYFESNPSGTLCLYMNSQLLFFNLITRNAYDQDNKQYAAFARTINGQVYVPAEFVCGFFNLTYSYFSTDIAPMIRICSTSAVYNDKTFVGINHNDMVAEFNAYTAPVETAAASTVVSPSPSATYENITLFLSFSNIGAGYPESILSTLRSYGLRGCFFVSSDEVLKNADLVRRIAGEGHLLGIRLTKGTLEEYTSASALLFEAAQIKTLIVTADSKVQTEAKSMADKNGLIYWKPTVTFGLQSESLKTASGRLPTDPGDRGNIMFSCSRETADIFSGMLAFLEDHKYNVRQISETVRPV